MITAFCVLQARVARALKMGLRTKKIEGKQQMQLLIYARPMKYKHTKPGVLESFRVWSGGGSSK
jgi:hypothetical protein